MGESDQSAGALMVLGLSSCGWRQELGICFAWLCDHGYLPSDASLLYRAIVRVVFRVGGSVRVRDQLWMDPKYHFCSWYSPGGIFLILIKEEQY